MRLADIWRAGLDGLPLPRSAWRQTKGEGNGMFKHGLYTKEAMKERAANALATPRSDLMPLP
jgi:hypothetical protein